MNAASSVAIAVNFTWLGMVLAISFLEAPLKFRVRGVSVQIGLAIGRAVFRFLNAIEGVLAVVVLVALFAEPMPVRVVAAMTVAVAALLVQLVLVRPVLNRRTEAVLAGQDAPRSRAHYAYIALEALKVAALIVGGILLLAA